MFRSAQHGSAIYKKDSKVSFPRISSVQFFDVDLLHLKHRFHDSFGLLGIFVVQHVDQHGWSDLPRHAEFVPEPTALRLFTASAVSFSQK